MIALTLGGAACVVDDALSALSWLMAHRARGNLCVIAVNAAWAHFRHVDHWVTLHPEHLYDDEHAWLATRQSMGWCSDPVTWGGIWPTGRNDSRPWAGRPALTDRAHPVYLGPDGMNGSSGMHAVDIARDELDADRIICCGIPMDPAEGHAGEVGRWDAADDHWPTWLAAHEAGRLDNVRSMSGRTRELLKAPDVEWLKGGVHADQG